MTDSPSLVAVMAFELVGQGATLFCLGWLAWWVVTIAVRRCLADYGRAEGIHQSLLKAADGNHAVVVVMAVRVGDGAVTVTGTGDTPAAAGAKVIAAANRFKEKEDQ